MCCDNESLGLSLGNQWLGLAPGPAFLWLIADQTWLGSVGAVSGEGGSWQHYDSDAVAYFRSNILDDTKQGTLIGEF